MSVQDAKKATLVAYGYTSEIDDAYRNYLLSETGSTTGQVNDLERKLFTSYGYTGTLDDMWNSYLTASGYFGSLGDKLYDFWTAGQGFTPFWAPLTNSLVLSRGTGTPTFTRATAKRGQNNDGYQFTGISGEAIFTGARRIRNLCPTPSTTIAVAGNKTITVTPGVYVFSMGAEATGTCVITFTGTATGSTGTLTANASARTSKVLTITVGGTIIATCTVQAAADVQFEDVTAQTTQTAGEYVSVGVLSAPYHGAGIDGVKYFDTDISGSPIASTTLLGYNSEGARTNLCLQSNAFTTTWGEVGGTLAATQNAVGPDGATSAWTFTDDDASNVEGRSQNITLTAAAYTFSVFVKKTTGAQTAYPCLLVNTGTTYAVCTIDTSNGVATNWTAVTGGTMLASTSARISSFNNALWRVELTYTGTVAAYAHQIIPAATTNATQSTGAFDIAAVGSHVFFGAQVELGAFASSYIATTTIAVARNADVLTYPSAGNSSNTSGALYAEITSCPATGNAFVLQLDQVGTNGMFLASTAVARMADSTNNINTSSGTFASGTSKVAGAWSASTSVMKSANKGTVASGVFDGTFGTNAQINIGGYAGASAIFCPIKNVRIWQRALSSSELQSITA